ncbi:transmembrane protein 151A-like [Balamuthia mandrillaris]
MSKSTARQRRVPPFLCTHVACTTASGTRFEGKDSRSLNEHEKTKRAHRTCRQSATPCATCLLRTGTPAHRAAAKQERQEAEREQKREAKEKAIERAVKKMKEVDPEVSNVDLEVAKAAIEGVLLTNLADGVVMLAQHYPMVTTHVQANLCSEPGRTPKKNSSTIATGNTNRAALPQLPNKFAELLMVDCRDEDPWTQKVVHDIKAQAKQVNGPLVALPCNRSRKMSHAEAYSSDCYSTLCLPSSFSMLNASTPVSRPTSPTYLSQGAGGFSVIGLTLQQRGGPAGKPSGECNNNSPNTKEMVLRRSSRLKNKKKQQHHQGTRADVQHTPNVDDEKENSLRAAQEINSLNVSDKIARTKSTATKPKRRLAKPCIKGKQAKEPAREAAHKAERKRSLISRIIVKSHFAAKKEATGLPLIREKKEQTEKKAEEVEEEEEEEEEEEQQQQQQQEEELEQEQEQEKVVVEDEEVQAKDTENLDNTEDKTHVKRVEVVLMSAEPEEPRRDDPLPAEQSNDAEEDECQRANPSCKAPAEQEVDRQQPKTSEQLFQRQTNATASKSGEAEEVSTRSAASSSPLLKPKKKTSAAPVMISHKSTTTNNSSAGSSSPSSCRFSSIYSISSSLSSSPPVHSNYEMTPYQSSDEETDSENEEKSKKKIPGWACKEELLLEVQHQAQTDPDEIFCINYWDTLDLEEIFKYNCSRFTHWRSSGNWTEDRLTFLENREYKQQMGFI